jgi:uncharacterized protein (TIGR00369 family)
MGDAATPGFGAEQAQAMLAEHFAPWVQALGLVYLEAGPARTLALLPLSDQLTRVGGMICGQALAAAADTTAVMALCAHAGRLILPATVNLSLNFARPLVGDAEIEARILRAGKTLAFADVMVRQRTADGAPGPLCAHGTSAMALPAG